MTKIVLGKESKKAEVFFLVAKLRTPIAIGVGVAQARFAHVLFHDRLRPAADFFEIAKIRFLIPMRVPKLNVAERRSAIGDRIPLTGARVYADGIILNFYFVDHLAKKSDVVRRRSTPIFGAFNVDPYLSNLRVILFQIVDGRLNLASRISAFETRENVPVDVGDAGGSGVFDRVRRVGVDLAEAAINADDGERDVLVLHARPRLLWNKSANVDAKFRFRHGDEYSEDECHEK